MHPFARVFASFRLVVGRLKRGQTVILVIQISAVSEVKVQKVSLKRVSLLLGSLTLAVILVGCEATGQESGAGAPPPPPQIEVAEVRSEEVTLWGMFTGRIAAPETVDLRPRVSGYIERVAFTEGELVQQGDVLFVIDSRPYLARERLARAELARAQSQLDLAITESQRATELWERRAISQEELEQRTAAVTVAKANVKAAAAALENAEIELEYTLIKAPVSGRIGRAEITRGNLATADVSLLATLVSVDPVFVYFQTDQQTVERNRNGSQEPVPVRVQLQETGGKSYAGQLDFVDNQYDAQTGTLQYRAVIDNPDHDLKPGQFARVEMPIGTVADAVLLDQKAVMTDQDRRYVYVLDKENKVSRKFIKTGHRFEGLVVINDGLQGGERVVVNGLQRIAFPGMEVSPQTVEMHRTLNPSVAVRP